MALVNGRVEVRFVEKDFPLDQLPSSARAIVSRVNRLDSAKERADVSINLGVSIDPQVVIVLPASGIVASFPVWSKTKVTVARTSDGKISSRDFTENVPNSDQWALNVLRWILYGE